MKIQNNSQIVRLIKQYPFIRNDTKGFNQETSIISIKVHKLGGDVLYADTHSMGQISYFLSRGQKYVEFIKYDVGKGRHSLKRQLLEEDASYLQGALFLIRVERNDSAPHKEIIIYKVPKVGLYSFVREHDLFTIPLNYDGYMRNKLENFSHKEREVIQRKMEKIREICIFDIIFGGNIRSFLQDRHNDVEVRYKMKIGDDIEVVITSSINLNGNVLCQIDKEGLKLGFEFNYQNNNPNVFLTDILGHLNDINSLVSEVCDFLEKTPDLDGILKKYF